jgi:hypothetical protein
MQGPKENFLTSTDKLLAFKNKLQVPSTAPMFPSLIVYCVNEVDLHGLNDVEVYRISDAEKDSMELRVQNIPMAHTFF